MYFGEFLLQKKVINEDQLLDALVYQVEHMPSFLKVLRKEESFSATEILRLIQLQIESNSDLVGILKTEKNYNDEKINELYKKQVAHREMLGSVLVRLEYITQSVLETMLHDFLKVKDEIMSLPTEKNENVKIEPNFSETPIENNTSARSENIFVDEYLNLFSEKMNKKLNKLVTIIHDAASNESGAGQYLSSLYRDLYILKGAANLASLQYTVNLLKKWDEVIEKKLVLKDEKEFHAWCLSSNSALKLTIDFIWDLRGNIVNTGNDDIENNPDVHGRYLELVTMLESHC